MSSISRATAPVFPCHHKLKFDLISFGSRLGLKKDLILESSILRTDMVKCCLKSWPYETRQDKSLFTIHVGT